MGPFLCPPKISENQPFSEVSRGFRKGILAWNWILKSQDRLKYLQGLLFDRRCKMMTKWWRNWCPFWWCLLFKRLFINFQYLKIINVHMLKPWLNVLQLWCGSFWDLGNFYLIDSWHSPMAVFYVKICKQLRWTLFGKTLTLINFSATLLCLGKHQFLFYYISAYTLRPIISLKS